MNSPQRNVGVFALVVALFLPGCNEPIEPYLADQNSENKTEQEPKSKKSNAPELMDAEPRSPIASPVEQVTPEAVSYTHLTLPTKA